LAGSLPQSCGIINAKTNTMGLVEFAESRIIKAFRNVTSQGVPDFSTSAVNLMII